MDNLEHWVEEIMAEFGVPDDWAIYLRLLTFLFVLTLIAGGAFWVTKRVVIRYVYRLIRQSAIQWDDVLADHEVFNNVAHIVPAVVVRVLAPGIFDDFKFFLPYVIKLTDAYLIVVGMTIVFAFLKVGELTLAGHAAFKDKPLTSYFQLTRIILYLATAILALSVILGKSPIYFLSAFGAMTAVLLLIFKDTILGLVASVQMSTNDMVRVGDWVEMPKFNADGDVIAINLNTIKVQNFDKTITTIPTYYFITDSFKNWRGMEQSGGRRIKRPLYINAQTVRFVDPEAREAYKKYHLITGYVTDRQNEIEHYNVRNEVDTSVLINGRRMTNLGVFRHYIENYLKHHPRVRQDMTIMVRQLESEDHGIPLEVYCFTNTTAWVEYESIQSDIFDHLFSAVRYFGLELFQRPTGNDITAAVGSLKFKASSSELKD